MLNRMERTGRRLAVSLMAGRQHFLRRYRHAVNIASGVTSIVCFLAATAALTAIILYGGFDGSAISRSVLRHMINGSRLVFIISILFNIVFNFRASFADAHIAKKAADIAVLLTVIPLLWPQASAGHSLIWFLYNRWFLIGVTGLYSLAEICLGIMRILARRTNPSLILSVSFLFFIFIGSFVLGMPRCTTHPVSYVDSLFMAASAVSMTGMTTVDFATAYTPLGWGIVAVLMQIGALGVLTFTSFFALFFSGRTSIYNQLLMRDFVFSKSMSSLGSVVLYILIFTLSVEIVGAVAIWMCVPDGFFNKESDRIFFAAFHSVSAFCNGGFSTLPDGMATPAILRSGGVLYIVLTVLILAGGIGFPNLVNFKDAATEYFRRIRDRILHRPQRERRRHIYDLNTKLVLIASAVLFIGGAISFFVLEYDGALAGMPFGKKIVQSVFNSATVRTAGFSSMPLSAFSHSMLLIIMFLMWVGCASQSMGGGIKVNTLMVALFNLRSVVRGYRGVTAMGRNIALPSVRRAHSVIVLFLLAFLAYTFTIMALQPELPFSHVAFECFSALTTVGLSMGTTAKLCTASKLILATAMFLGRVGIISVLCGLVGQRHDPSDHLPTDEIIIN